MNRQFQLRRLLGLRNTFQAALDELRRLLGNGSVTGFDRYLSNLRQGLANAGLDLSSVSLHQGQLVYVESLPDAEADERAARLERPELFRAYEHSTNPDRRPVLVAEIRKLIESLPRHYKRTERQIGLCDGWKAISSKDSPRNLLKEAIQIFNSLGLSRASGSWKNKDFAKLQKDCLQIFSNLQRATNLLAKHAALLQGKISRSSLDGPERTGSS